MSALPQNEPCEQRISECNLASPLFGKTTVIPPLRFAPPLSHSVSRKSVTEGGCITPKNMIGEVEEELPLPSDVLQPAAKASATLEWPSSHGLGAQVRDQQECPFSERRRTHQETSATKTRAFSVYLSLSKKTLASNGVSSNETRSRTAIASRSSAVCILWT